MATTQKSLSLTINPVGTQTLFDRILGPFKPTSQWTNSFESSMATWFPNKPANLLFTEPENSNLGYGWLGPNFYDRCAWAYRYATASGRQDILDRARFYAREVSNETYMANAEIRATGGDPNYQLPMPSNRDNSPLGLAIAATDNRDSVTRDIALNGLARSAYIGKIIVSQTTFKDPRENGNGLLAESLSHAVGPNATPQRWGVSWDSLAITTVHLNTILAAQQSWGGWNTVYPTNGVIETPTYMQGLTLAGLQAYYDYVSPDPRIIPAVIKCITWLRDRRKPAGQTNSSNYSAGPGWIYSYGADGITQINGAVYPVLSGGILIGPFMWLWQKTQDIQWKNLAESSFQALVNEHVARPGGIAISKEVNQCARPIVNWIAVR